MAQTPQPGIPVLPLTQLPPAFPLVLSHPFNWGSYWPQNPLLPGFPAFAWAVSLTWNALCPGLSFAPSFKHNSSPVSSRKLPLTCLTQSSIGFLLDHGLVAGREALPYLTVWCADIGEAGPLSEWGGGRPSTCGTIPRGSFQPGSLLPEICVLHHGMGSGAQTTPPPTPRHLKGD